MTSACLSLFCNGCVFVKWRLWFIMHRHLRQDSWKPIKISSHFVFLSTYLSEWENMWMPLHFSSMQFWLEKPSVSVLLLPSASWSWVIFTLLFVFSGSGFPNKSMLFSASLDKYYTNYTCRGFCIYINIILYYYWKMGSTEIKGVKMPMYTRLKILLYYWRPIWIPPWNYVKAWI